jgi:hypothetical protein
MIKRKNTAFYLQILKSKKYIDEGSVQSLDRIHLPDYIQSIAVMDCKLESFKEILILFIRSNSEECALDQTRF